MVYLFSVVVGNANFGGGEGRVRRKTMAIGLKGSLNIINVVNFFLVHTIQQISIMFLISINTCLRKCLRLWMREVIP